MASAPTDGELIRRARAGDDDAFGQLVSRHMRRAYFAALGLVGSREDALDLSQEAFARAFRARQSLDPDRPFYAWYYAALRRLCFNFLRDRRRRDAWIVEDAVWIETAAISTVESPERAAERRDDARRLANHRHRDVAVVCGAPAVVGGAGGNPMTAPDTSARARDLMMAALDGEIGEADRVELDELLARDQALRDEWARLARVKEATGTMTMREPTPETWDRYWRSVYNRAERKVAWLLVGAGAVVLLGYGLWHAVPVLAERLFNATDVPVVVRGGVAAVLTGAVLLVASVIREQLSVRRTDTYSKGVER
jgi:hypothetical protein